MIQGWRIATLAVACSVLLSACVTLVDGAALQKTAVGYRLDDATVAPSPYRDVRWKAVLVAGDNSIRAFDNGVNALAGKFEARGVEVAKKLTATKSRLGPDILLSSEENIETAIAGLALRDGEGCLIYMTSHGFPNGGLLVANRAQFMPARLGRAISSGCGDRPTVLVVSGCYTGHFINEGTAASNRIILTAAESVRTSFGCGSMDEYTYYDDCFLQSLDGAHTWQDLYGRIRQCVSGREALIKRTPSEPQAFFGRRMKDAPLPGATVVAGGGTARQ